jgi:hypothetical protein
MERRALSPYSGKIKKWVLRLAQVVLFVLVSWVLIYPSWQVMEKLWTRDISSALLDPGVVPVLVHSSSENKYQIGGFPRPSPEGECEDEGGRDKSSEAVLVTDVRDADLDEINKDLSSRIHVEGYQYNYFKVIRRGEGYTDVSLEVPTTGDFWGKSWYRLQNGAVHPQRIMFFGPIFGMFVAIPAVLGGVIAVLTLRLIIRRKLGGGVSNAQLQTGEPSF